MIFYIYTQIYRPYVEFWIDSSCAVLEEVWKACIWATFRFSLLLLNLTFSYFFLPLGAIPQLRHEDPRGGHELFGRHQGFNAFLEGRYRGWIEEFHLFLQTIISMFFNGARRFAKVLLLINFQHHEQEQDIAPGVTYGPLVMQRFLEEQGYPHELHTVQTDDGYILFLHRLPRKNAKDTVFFQHGVLDTSLGWVACGFRGSLALAAWENEYDVWIGNCRSNPPTIHINKGLKSGEYWRYSLNELGIQDVGAQIAHIHEIKCRELQPDLNHPMNSPRSENCRIHHSGVLDSKPVQIFQSPRSEGCQLNRSGGLEAILDDNNKPLPYSLRVVAHSLGGAACLIYLVHSLHRKKKHYIKKLILMSPSGFHFRYPKLLLPLLWLLPSTVWFMENILHIRGAPLIIPGYYPRLVFFNTIRDVLRVPAIREWMRRCVQWLMNGDISPWVPILQLPHYDAESMPAISVHSGIHLIQMVTARRFQLFDYGNPTTNREHYGTSNPLNIAAEYNRIDIPVDIIAGRFDGVIPPVCVREHYKIMEEAQRNVTYEEFRCGHLDFSARAPPDVQTYILNRLQNI